MKNINYNDMTEQEQVEVFRLITDAYIEKHKIKTKVLCVVLRHMMLKIGTSATIYYLMQQVRENKRTLKTDS